MQLRRFHWRVITTSSRTSRFHNFHAHCSFRLVFSCVTEAFTHNTSAITKIPNIVNIANVNPNIVPKSQFTKTSYTDLTFTVPFGSSS